MKAPVIRISIGKFDADKAAIVEKKLAESRAGLEAGIRGVNGPIACYVGVDRTNNAMHNVCAWERSRRESNGGLLADDRARGRVRRARRSVRQADLELRYTWQLDDKLFIYFASRSQK